MPWLSVLMPVYNGAAHLAQALASIEAQGDRAIEVIAIDDGSTDETIDLLEAFSNRLPLTIERLPHGGNWVANTNRALARARAELVTILHQDDRWLPGRLGRIADLHRQHPRAALLLHATRFIADDGRAAGGWRCPLPPGLVPSQVVLERLLVQNFVAIPAAAFLRRTALDVGGMDEQLWYTADWDLWMKLAAAGPVAYTPEVLAEFRIHARSQTSTRSHDSPEFRRQLEIVVDRHLQRFRPTAAAVRAARASIEVNVALAALAHRQQPQWMRLLRTMTPLLLGGGHRLVRDSRLFERLSARLR